jgi:hypothetical protein
MRVVAVRLKKDKNEPQKMRRLFFGGVKGREIESRRGKGL